jgi:hypothetical protein
MKNSFNINSVSAEIRASDLPDMSKKNSVYHKHVRTGIQQRIPGFQTPVTWGKKRNLKILVLLL